MKLFYPPENKLKAHSKFISKSLGLKLSHAMEAVAFMYGCNNWRELINKAELPYQLSCVGELHSCVFKDSFHFYIPPQKVKQFDWLINEYFEELILFQKTLPTVQGSLFEKIINKDYSKVSGHVIRNIIKVCKEKPRSFEFLKSELIHQEDTFLKPLILLNGELRKNVMFQNLRVMPYRIFLCSNYSFQDSNVCNIDIDISLDINMPNKVTSNNDLLFNGKVCNRKWFAGFIIGYLNLFIQQVKSAGYAGSLFIHSVNSASVKNYFSCQKDTNRTHGIESTFKQLIELGEMSNSKGRGGLIGNRLAIELPFDGAASKRASGEVLL